MMRGLTTCSFMKSPVAILLLTVLLASNAGAQYSRAIQKAKGLPDKINERYRTAENGAPPPGPAAPPAAPAAPTAAQPPAAPIKPSTQQQAATKLKADLVEVRAKGEATAEMKKQFVQDLSATVQGYNRPSLEALTRFSESLLAATATKKSTLADDARLVKNIVISLNSAGLSTERLQEISEEIQAVLTKSGVSADQTGLIAQNLSAAVSDVQSGGK